MHLLHVELELHCAMAIKFKSILAVSFTAALAAATSSPAAGKSFSGAASYYKHGARVASGARFNPHGMTAAHRTLPFGTKIRVTDHRSGRSVIVTVNDRGPFIRGRVLDLSLGAAKALGMVGRGVARVHAEVL